MDSPDQNPFSRRDFVKTAVKGAVVTSAAFAFPAIVPSSVFGKTAPSNKINIAQIGCGRIARVHDLPSTLKCDAARIMAVCDLDSNRVQSTKQFIQDFYAKSTGQSNYMDVKPYSNYHEVLANKEIDAVIISTPDHWHAQLAIESALAGKHIYCQKPTSLTIQEGRTMSDMIRKTGVVFQLGSQQRSVKPWPQFKRACELVRNGRIGKLKTIRIGLPGDPSGGIATEMPVPANFNYDTWLGSTPYIYYTLDRTHSQTSITARPGWLRCEQFGAGMITGWGVHHFDIAHWAMDAEYSGPLEAEAHATFPKTGLWNVHGDFEVNLKYHNDVNVVVSGKYPNGLRFEGTDGWIFVTRDDTVVTPSDPPPNLDKKALTFQVSDPKLLTTVIGPNEIHLYESPEQHQNWLDSIQNNTPNISPPEVAHRSCSACLVAHAAMKVPRKLYWNPHKEHFKNDDEANKLLSRPQRYPYGTSYIGAKIS